MKIGNKYSDKPMTPFIAVCAFIILMTLILISFQQFSNSATRSASGPDYGKSTMVRLSLDTRESPDFSFSEYDHASPIIAAQFRNDRLAFYESILKIRRMIAFGQYQEAENELRTLYLFFPEDPELVGLLSMTLAHQGKSEENIYYRDQLLFLQEHPELDLDTGGPR